jgi:predicted nucleic acid-binding protein
LPYLLDTNTVSYVMERRPAIVAKVAEAGGVNNLAITAITVAELRYGDEAMPEGRRNDRFFEHIERVCGLRFERWEL